MQDIWRQASRTAHPGFLVNRQQRLDRPMFEIGSLQNRQNQRHANAVVGPQRGAVGNQPAVATLRPDRVAREVMRRIGIVLAHHVQMRLQDDAGEIFPPRAGRLADNQVAGGVDRGSQPALTGPGQQVLPQFRLLLRGARNRAQQGEMIPDNRGFKTRKHGLLAKYRTWRLPRKTPANLAACGGLYLGRLMGLEPTTTGITIRDSTN